MCQQSAPAETCHHLLDQSEHLFTFCFSKQWTVKLLKMDKLLCHNNKVQNYIATWKNKLHCNVCNLRYAFFEWWDKIQSRATLSDTPYWHQDVVVSWLTYISMWSVVRVTRLSGYFSLAVEAADLTLTWVLTYDSCKQPASWTTDDCSFFFKSTLFYHY